jgi:hypothetical protein
MFEYFQDLLPFHEEDNLFKTNTTVFLQPFILLVIPVEYGHDGTI